MADRNRQGSSTDLRAGEMLSVLGMAGAGRYRYESPGTRIAQNIQKSSVGTFATLLPSIVI